MRLEASQSNLFSELFDKSIKNVKLEIFGEVKVYKFLLLKNTKENPNDFDLHYEVSFERPEESWRKYEDENGNLVPFYANLSEVSFSNNTTGMNPLSSDGFQGVNSAIVFSTVISILFSYMKDTRSVQGVKFSAYNKKLHTLYKLLAHSIDKRGDLRWTTRNSVMKKNGESFILIRSDFFRKLNLGG